MTRYLEPDGKISISWDSEAEPVDWTTPDTGDGIGDEYCGNCGWDSPGCGCPRDTDYQGSDPKTLPVQGRDDAPIPVEQRPLAPRHSCCALPDDLPRGVLALAFERDAGGTPVSARIDRASPSLIIRADVLDSVADAPPPFATLTPGTSRPCSCGCGRAVPHAGGRLAITGTDRQVTYDIGDYVCGADGYLADLAGEPRRAAQEAAR